MMKLIHAVSRAAKPATIQRQSRARAVSDTMTPAAAADPSSVCPSGRPRARRDEAREDGDRAGERKREADGDLVEAVLFAEDVEHERLDALLAKVRDEH